MQCDAIRDSKARDGRVSQGSHSFDSYAGSMRIMVAGCLARGVGCCVRVFGIWVVVRGGAVGSMRAW